MKYPKIIISALAFIVTAALEAKTPGMAAYREQNYGAAARLLSRELSDMQVGSDDYFEHKLACIESMFFSGRTADGAKELASLSEQIPDKFKNRVLLLNAQLAYMQKNFKLCQNCWMTSVLQKICPPPYVTILRL